MGMRTTPHMRRRIEERGIRYEWCVAIVEQPARKEVQEDGRIRHWGFVAELGSKGQWVRVVLENDGETLVTAHPDRGFKP